MNHLLILTISWETWLKWHSWEWPWLEIRTEAVGTATLAYSFLAPWVSVAVIVINKKRIKKNCDTARIHVYQYIMFSSFCCGFLELWIQWIWKDRGWRLETQYRYICNFLKVRTSLIFEKCIFDVWLYYSIFVSKWQLPLRLNSFYFQVLNVRSIFITQRHHCQFLR